jgi:DNA polymerase-3 subunit gamma/tau
MAKALYRKYRSKSLDEVIGQKHVTDILSRAIANGHISHAYLLTGPRGVGKTSVARILAHEINGLAYDEEATNLDIIEIDAASNNGVEDVRDLREKAQIAPVSAKKKVYIIDEVHMLSKAAFNALLKTLEEPPEHVVFILATTNAEKLPATIISRAQRFSFRPITIDDATKHLANIAKQEHIKITDDAIKLIAERSDGSFRDSISLLDQLSNLVDANDKETITSELIENTLGLTSNNVIAQLIDAVESRNLSEVVKILTDTLNSGISTAVLVTQLTTTISDRIADKPQLLPLLDALIDVQKSPQPQLKLLSVLGIAATPKQSPKSVALAAPVFEVSASIAELEQQAAKKQPTESAIKRVLKNESVPITADTKTKQKVDTQEFDWARLVEYTRKNYIALYSVLSKCTPELDGQDLTLYACNNFYKKKLDDIKYHPLLMQCLEDNGVFGLNIHTLPTTIPPKGVHAAAIAAIMGGGEEVSLEPT